MLNKLRLDVSMHHLKTYGDVFAQLGGGSDLAPATLLLSSQPITVKEFNEHIATPLYEKLSRKLREEIADAEASQQANGLAGEDRKVGDSPEQGSLSLHPTNSQARKETPTTARRTQQEEYQREAQLTPPSWWLDELPGKKCVLFRHQTRASIALADQLVERNHRAALLRAGVGVGKTFIFYEFIAQLWHSGWFAKHKTFSPWPVLIVTKASIVEQTRRVGVDLFGLDPYRQFKVINYDGLRAAAGKHMIKDETVVEDGVARKKWSWYPGVHPKVFILDESQSAKNEGAQQSEICFSIAKIEDPDVKVICSSATPFVRVSESKYFVINADIKHNII